MRIRKIVSTTLIVTMLIICMTIIVILMRGETKTSGQNPADIDGRALTCESTAINYPIATYDNSVSKNLKIVTNFQNDKPDAISLVYELYYDNTQQITASEAVNHANMNTSFGKDGLEADAFDAHYSKMENSMKMNLYAKASEIKPIATKYFMIDAHDTDELPNTIQKYQHNYEKQGFTCILNDK